MTDEANPGYCTVEHAAELSRRLAAERMKVDARDKRIEILECERDGWKTSATVRGEAANKLAAEVVSWKSDYEKKDAHHLICIDQRDAARAETITQIKIKMMMSEGRERFLRALQSIASEPCASRLVSGQECDPGSFPCARCKAKQAIRESEKAFKETS